LYNILLTYFS